MLPVSRELNRYPWRFSPIKVLVCGGRDFDDYYRIASPKSLLYEGGCLSVNRAKAWVAPANSRTPFPPHWSHRIGDLPWPR